MLQGLGFEFFTVLHCLSSGEHRRGASLKIVLAEGEAYTSEFQSPGSVLFLCFSYELTSAPFSVRVCDTLLSYDGQ